MRIRWTVAAADDSDSLKNYLQQHHAHLAEPTVRTIYERMRSLKTSPNRGRRGHRNGARELAVMPLPYVVVYSVKAEPSKSCRFITVRKTGAESGFSH
jgi:plasmid stabilization system protein ParE